MSDNNLNLQRLIECRNKIGLTKIEASKRIGISQPAYLRYESGERTPSLPVIREIARVFRTSPDYLLGKTDSPEIETYTITQTEDPEMFSILQRYYHADKEQLARLTAYLEHFQ